MFPRLILSTSPGSYFVNFIRRSSHRCKSSTASSTLQRSRIGIGGSKLTQTPNSSIYASVIYTALRNGITTFDSGIGGEESLSKAYKEALSLSSKNNTTDLVMEATPRLLTARFGYRTENKDAGDKIFSHDVFLEQQSSDSNLVFHNISQEYFDYCLLSSPLIQLRADNPNIHLLYMVHNPEVQATLLHNKGAPNDEVRDLVKERLTDSFLALENAVADNRISSYGICSNGLSLPDTHPLHLNWKLVLTAANDAVDKAHGYSSNMKARFSTLQLPANLLETQGLQVAKDVKEYLSSSDQNLSQNRPSSVDIFITRPLTCYPDRGTGTGHPFKLVDYTIPNDYEDVHSPVTWTHDIKASTPMSYIPIMNKVLSHFDATHIIEQADKENRKLTVEERETIDGCRLLQSMIHDLNSNLSSGTLRSFISYEEDLYKKVVPLIHGTFEELDEDSSTLLQKFFKAHGGAVRHSIAKATRNLLKQGGNGVVPYDISDSQTLQAFALQYLLKQKWGPTGEFLVDKVIIGCPRSEHVIEAIDAVDKITE